MDNLKEFEDFSNYINESSKVPVYNEVESQKNIKATSDVELPYSKVAAKITELLADKKAGIITKITVVADIPTQGKGAPDYIKEVISKERERLASIHKAKIGKDSEMDTDDGDFNFDINRFGEKRNLFFDSEFEIVGVEDGLIIGIPHSLKGKGDEYKAKIKPEQIEEIYYTNK